MCSPAQKEILLKTLGEEKTIRFECGFCQEGRMCKECGEEHRSWCNVRDDWHEVEE